MKIVLNRLLNQIIEFNKIYKFENRYLIYFHLKSIEFGILKKNYLLWMNYRVVRFF